jgi:hypothetical protein
LAGYEVSVTNLRKPILHVSTDLDTFLALLEPRSSRGKRHNLKFVAVTSGLGLVFAAVLVPLPTPEAKPRLELKESNPCSLAEIKKAISGATEDSKIEFLGAETFGGVTSGSLLCEGLKYSYALESKGLERVLKVRRLDS